MTVIEIQTVEGGRLAWAAIYSGSDREQAIEWAGSLLRGMGAFKPALRVTDGLYGPVIGTWQSGVFEAK